MKGSAPILLDNLSPGEPEVFERNLWSFLEAAKALWPTASGRYPMSDGGSPMGLRPTGAAAPAARPGSARLRIPPEAANLCAVPAP